MFQARRFRGRSRARSNFALGNNSAKRSSSPRRARRARSPQETYSIHLRALRVLRGYHPLCGPPRGLFFALQSGVRSARLGDLYICTLPNRPGRDFGMRRNHKGSAAIALSNSGTLAPQDAGLPARGGGPNATYFTLPAGGSDAVAAGEGYEKPGLTPRCTLPARSSRPSRREGEFRPRRKRGMVGQERLLCRENWDSPPGNGNARTNRKVDGSGGAARGVEVGG